MRPEPQFVAGDWGTSHLRLFLCAADGSVLETSNGPGAAQVPGAHAAALESLIEPWQHRRAPLPVILCGMVGSSLGWVQAPYVTCPARPEQIADGCVGRWNGRVQIIPGLSCHNHFGAPDVLRGEETQILGAMSLEPRLQRGRHLLCLPGTHTKWVVLEEGRVSHFLTAPTGELYALLCAHSVLVGAPQTPEGAADDAAFRKGLLEFNRFTRAQLLHRLFECRSRHLTGELTGHQPAAFLSGLLIASDVYGALATLALAESNETVTLVGTSRLTALYAAALTLHQRCSQNLDGAAASLAGLIQVHRQLVGRVPAHAN